jgi:hypothetical protein
MDNGKKGLIKIALIVFTIMYIVSPVDLLSGLPIDDIIVLIIHFFVQNRLMQKSEIYPATGTYNTYTENVVDSNEV